MNPELKAYLINLFLNIKFPTTFEKSWLNNKDLVQILDEEIESINQSFPDLLALKGQIEAPNLHIFLSLLDKTVYFPNSNTPKDFEVKQHLNDQNIFVNTLATLSNVNYTTRKTGSITEDKEFNELKSKATSSLLTLVKAKIPKLKSLEIT